MELNEYQRHTDKFAIYPNSIADLAIGVLKIDPAVTLESPETIQILELIYTSLGLAGEAGEVANKVKKLLRNDHPLTDEFKQAVKDELGDVLWYVAQVALALGIPLDDVGVGNIDKLTIRAQNGTIKGSGDSR